MKKREGENVYRIKVNLRQELIEKISLTLASIRELKQDKHEIQKCELN